VQRARAPPRQLDFGDAMLILRKSVVPRARYLVSVMPPDGWWWRPSGTPPSRSASPACSGRRRTRVAIVLGQPGVDPILGSAVLGGGGGSFVFSYPSGHLLLATGGGGGGSNASSYSSGGNGTGGGGMVLDKHLGWIEIPGGGVGGFNGSGGGGGLGTNDTFIVGGQPSDAATFGSSGGQGFGGNGGDSRLPGGQPDRRGVAGGGGGGGFNFAGSFIGGTAGLAFPNSTYFSSLSACFPGFFIPQINSDGGFGGGSGGASEFGGEQPGSGGGGGFSRVESLRSLWPPRAGASASAARRTAALARAHHDVRFPHSECHAVRRPGDDCVGGGVADEREGLPQKGRHVHAQQRAGAASASASAARGAAAAAAPPAAPAPRGIQPAALARRGGPERAVGNDLGARTGVARSVSYDIQKSWDGKYGPGAENPRIIRPKRRRRKYGAHMGAGRDVAHRDVSCRRTCTETLNICLPRQPEARLGSVLHALVFCRRLWGLARCVALTKGRLTYRCYPAGPRQPLSTSRFAPGGVGGRATYFPGAFP
jgi:hypothetical protein